jgi:hypothetical protein
MEGAGLGWAGLGWAGLGWAGLGWEIKQRLAAPCANYIPTLSDLLAICYIIAIAATITRLS